MIKQLSNIGVTSDMAYAAAIGSIVLSIIMWFRSSETDAPHAERFGIFVGLWPPTLAIIGHALEEHERSL
jgi:hypothetical protein